MARKRFSNRAQRVIQFANQEALQLNHEYVGPEHLLLGLIKEGNGIAVDVLKKFGIDLGGIRRKVQKIVRIGSDTVTMGRLPRTPLFKRILDTAIEEAEDLGHNHVGTEHVLIGILRNEHNFAAKVLTRYGLQLSAVRCEVLIRSVFKLLEYQGTTQKGTEREILIGKENNNNNDDAYTKAIGLQSRFEELLKSKREIENWYLHRAKMFHEKNFSWSRLVGAISIQVLELQEQIVGIDQPIGKE